MRILKSLVFHNDMSNTYVGLSVVLILETTQTCLHFLLAGSFAQVGATATPPTHEDDKY